MDRPSSKLLIIVPDFIILFYRDIPRHNAKYAVVRFEEGGISIIPKIWQINKKSTYWPKNSKNLRTLIIRANEPNKDWPTFNVEHIYGYYDVYEHALQQEKEAVKESESEAEDRIPGKRKIKTKKPFSPPPSLVSESESENSASGTSESSINKIVMNYDNDEKNELPQSTHPLEVNVVAIDTGNGMQNDGTMLADIIDVEVAPELSSDQILKKLDALDSKMNFIIMQLNTLASTDRSGDLKDQDLSKLPVLPLVSISQILEFENTLKNCAVTSKQLYKKFQQVAGRNGPEFLRRGLATVFDNKLAILCSWTGQKNNFRIRDCKIINVLKDAAQQIHKITDKEFEMVTMDWFRQANQRFRRGEQRVTGAT